MAGRSWDVTKRAEAVKALFPDRLPSHFAESIDPAKHGWGRDSHNELLRLIAANPAQRGIIIATYKAMFPGDAWVAAINFP